MNAAQIKEILMPVVEAIAARIRELEARVDALEAVKPLTFPKIDATAIPEKPSVIAAKRLKYEPFDYVERN
jgi:hypothetical protein